MNTKRDGGLIDWALASTSRKFGRVFEKRRGFLAKLAQFLSFEHRSLEEELGAAFYKLPPMSPAEVWRILGRELARGPKEVFEELELEACAAASIGQVHRGRLRTGERVAIKVQYPSVAAAIEYDVGLLRTATSVLPHRDLMRELVEEISVRLREECDFEGEADRTEWFRERLRLEGVRVPAVFRSASAKRVLTVEWLDGQHLRDWMAGAPARERADAAGSRVAGLFWSSVLELHRVHSDLHPGNLLFFEDGSVGLIDFGSTKELRPEFAQVVWDLFQATWSKDRAGAFEIARRGGLLGDLEKAEAEQHHRRTIEPFLDWLNVPCSAGTFDFGAARGLAVSGRKKFLEIVRANPRPGIYRDLLFLSRTVYLLYSVLERLGARIDLSAIIKARGGKDASADRAPDPSSRKGPRPRGPLSRAP